MVGSEDISDGEEEAGGKPANSEAPGTVPEEEEEEEGTTGPAAAAEDGVPDGGEDGAASSAVSQLQELVQSFSSFSPHTRILTWAFEQQLQEDTSLQFCATVSFVLGHVPHSFSGSWQSSKKKAQRDTAERVRRHLLQRLQQEGQVARTAIDPGCLPEDVIQELLEICQRQDGQALAEEGRRTEWSFEESGGSSSSQPPEGPLQHRAIFTFHADTMPYHFGGSWRESTEAAQRDTAERVLWYFGRTSEVFVPAESHTCSPFPRLAQPPEPHSTQEAVEDKTVLMRVQNALQKAFAKDTPPGQRVWLWSYEPAGRDPQVFRASVDVPSWGKSFTGEWSRGKKQAQRSACLVVKKYLDQLGS